MLSLHGIRCTVDSFLSSPNQRDGKGVKLGGKLMLLFSFPLMMICRLAEWSGRIYSYSYSPPQSNPSLSPALPLAVRACVISTPLSPTLQWHDSKYHNYLMDGRRKGREGRRGNWAKGENVTIHTVCANALWFSSYMNTLTLNSRRGVGPAAPPSPLYTDTPHRKKNIFGYYFNFVTNYFV